MITLIKRKLRHGAYTAKNSGRNWKDVKSLLRVIFERLRSREYYQYKMSRRVFCPGDFHFSCPSGDYMLIYADLKGFSEEIA